MEGLSDEDLISRYQESGDRRFANELFGRYYTRVSAWCFRITGDRERAADLAQDVFVKIHRNLDSFRGNAKFSTWVYTIARNHCFSEARSRSTKPVEESSETLNFLASGTAGADTLLEQEAARKLMQEFMGRVLDPTEKQVMVLHYVEELPLESVTRVLGLANQSGAKSFIVSARRKLKAEFDRWQLQNATKKVSRP